MQPLSSPQLRTAAAVTGGLASAWLALRICRWHLRQRGAMPANAFEGEEGEEEEQEIPEVRRQPLRTWQPQLLGHLQA